MKPSVHGLGLVRYALTIFLVVAVVVVVVHGSVEAISAVLTANVALVRVLLSVR